jgi:hypothetical protein
MSIPTLLGSLLAFLLTLAIFSRAFSATRIFRWAAYLLLGTGAGYVAAIVLKQVLLPAFSPDNLRIPIQFGVTVTAAVMIALLALRLTSRPSIRAWGLLPLGMMAGVGGALALAGAMRGSLLPQLMAVNTLHLQFLPRFPALDAFIVVIATLTSLGVLLFLLPGLGEREASGEERPVAMRVLYGWRLWGYWMLMLALGALLASTAGARITLLIERVQWLLGLWF